jgi:hypothetical protein
MHLIPELGYQDIETSAHVAGVPEGLKRRGREGFSDSAWRLTSLPASPGCFSRTASSYRDFVERVHCHRHIRKRDPRAVAP